MTLSEAARAMKGALADPSHESREMDGLELDTRRLRADGPGQLFFALKGEESDGHEFLEAAREAGAAAAVVHQDPATLEGAEDMPLIVVEDTYQALHDLTRHARAKSPDHLVAITGSVGKTSTKELLAACLGSRYRTARNEGNFNNLYGFPLSLLNIPDDTEWMVAEMGMSESGELGQVSRLGRPDVAVITTVQAVHIEFFGSLEAIADAKAELLEGLQDGGLLVANAADVNVARIGRRHRDEGTKGGRVVWYAAGEGGEAPDDLADAVVARVTGIESLGAGRTGYRVRLEHRVNPDDPETPGDAWAVQEIDLPLHGRYNVDNFLAAATTALVLGVSAEQIAAAVGDAQPPSLRGEVRRLPGDVTLVVDCYNSNPKALSRALESAVELPARRRWAVLGDMLELGEGASQAHSDAGREAAELGFEPVAAVGDLAAELAAAAADAGAVAHAFSDAEEAARWAVDELRDGDLVLIKGSRGVGLETVVEALETIRRGED